MERRELMRESEHYLAGNKDARRARVSSQWQLDAAEQRPPGVSTGRGCRPASHADAGIGLVGSPGHSAPASGLRAAAREDWGFRAARDASVGERETSLCRWRVGTLPENLPWRARARQALTPRSQRAGLLPGKLADVPFCPSSDLSSQSLRCQTAQPLSGC